MYCISTCHNSIKSACPYAHGNLHMPMDMYSNELHQHSCTHYTGALRLKVLVDVHHRASFCLLLLLLKVPVALLQAAKG